MPDDFSERIHSILGNQPQAPDKSAVLHMAQLPTPLCPMAACAGSRGVCLLEFMDNRRLERELQDLARLLNADIIPSENSHLETLRSELQDYFDGKLEKFTVPLDTPGTEFQQAVWKILQDIPYGETRSYKQQAVALGKPKAVRAVAAANGQNRVSIVIPCHRVIGADGSLTGYGGGLHRKKWLLDFEKVHGAQIRLFED
jgi:AraC family transcriptional regulator, regulatory protein of adaptative response / methylated-DNA-[protein]-cysteine methyltransferase